MQRIEPSVVLAAAAVVGIALYASAYVEQTGSRMAAAAKRFLDSLPQGKAEKSKRVTQMGNLIHPGENYHRVIEIVRSGILGTISKTRVWMAADRSVLGKPADCDPPAGCDYEFWLGPAPLRAFNPTGSPSTGAGSGTTAGAC